MLEMSAFVRVFKIRFSQHRFTPVPRSARVILTTLCLKPFILGKSAFPLSDVLGMFLL